MGKAKEAKKAAEAEARALDGKDEREGPKIDATRAAANGAGEEELFAKKLTKEEKKAAAAAAKAERQARKEAAGLSKTKSDNGSSASLFPRPSPHNFCYVSVDPIARHVKVWYSAYFPMM